MTDVMNKVVPHELRIMHPQHGDLKQTWDPDNDDEVRMARQAFDEAKRKGFMAYTVKRGGKRGEVIREFDPEAGQIIMAPALAGG